MPKGFLRLNYVAILFVLLNYLCEFSEKAVCCAIDTRGFEAGFLSSFYKNSLYSITRSYFQFAV